MGIIEFKNEIEKHYTGSTFGLITVQKDGDEFHSVGMGNGVMNTGFYYLILAQNSIFLPNEFGRVIDACTVTKSGFPVPGLVRRHPNKPEQQSHDDYIGFMAACAFLDYFRAAEVVKYGGKFNWVYDVERPFTSLNLSKSHDRFPGLVTYYKMCAGESASAWELLVFCLRILYMIFTLDKDGDTPIHAYCFVSVFKEKYNNVGAFFYFLLARQAKRKFGTIGKAFAAYYGETHPFARFEYDKGPENKSPALRSQSLVGSY